jgi:hypothetical protein
MSRYHSVVGFLRRSKKTVLIIAVTAIVTLASVFLISWRLDSQIIPHFPSLGALRTINVKAYWDESHLNETKEINWGLIYPGSSYNTTFFLQSISNVEATFELSTGNWTFRNSQGGIVLGPVNSTAYMNLTWNQVNRNVNPKETVQATLTLVVTDSLDFVLFLVNGDVQEFSVDIVISAVEST